MQKTGVNHRYGLDDIVKCLDRELRLRRRVYPGRVMTKRMTQKAADREIAIIQQLLLDHLAMQAREQAEFDLFLK